MRTRGVCLLLACSFAFHAWALWDTQENSLGVYFDSPTFDQYHVQLSVGEPVDMYFVLANCTYNSINGFIFAWRVVPDPGANLIVTDVILPPGALNVGDDHNFYVGMEELATSTATILVQATVVAMSPVFGDIQAGPVGSMMEARLFYGAGWVHPMGFSTVGIGEAIVDDQGWTDPAIAYFTQEVSTADDTWGAVKALFE